MFRQKSQLAQTINSISNDDEVIPYRKSADVVDIFSSVFNYFDTNLDNVQDQYGDMISNVFEKFVILGKVSLMGGLTYLSFKNNNDLSYVSSQPKPFLSECFLVGASVAIPTMICAYTHKPKNDPVNYMKLVNSVLITFLIFFVFHILMEFSGLNNIKTAAVDTNFQFNNIGKYLSNNALLISGLALSCLIAICSKNNGTFQRHPHVSKSKYAKKSPGIFWRTLAEATIFAGVNFAAYYKIYSDRCTEFNNGVKNSKLANKPKLLNPDDMTKKSGILAGMCFIGYFILQRGGVFDGLFNDSRDKDCRKWFGSTTERKREIFNNWLKDQDAEDKADYMSHWFESNEEKDKIVQAYNAMNSKKISINLSA